MPAARQVAASAAKKPIGAPVKASAVGLPGPPSGAF